MSEIPMRMLAVVALTLAACGADPSDLSKPDLVMRDFSMMPPNECMNGFTDGEETDQDCGGPTCAPCADGKSCKMGRDCASTFCTNNICDAASCIDGVKNGTESDQDCGGSCPGCAVGKKCNAGSDCLSMTCTNGVCALGQCEDGKQNGAETDADCGGGTCPGCGEGKMCQQGSDCKSAMCTNNLCKSPVMCMAGTADCDGNAGNGCEVNTTTDAKNCGRCGNLCGGGQACIKGACMAAASCKTVAGIRWCYNPNACGENCTQVCASLNLPFLIDDQTWFNAQNTAQKCQAINDAFSLGGMVEDPQGRLRTYGCIEDASAVHPQPGGLIGPLLCSDDPACPKNLRVGQDNFNAPCGQASRRAVCPCQ